MPKHFSQEEKTEIRNKLLDSALLLFERFGANKTTINDITNAAGVGKGTFYLFFASKGEIYIELLKREWLDGQKAIADKYTGRKGSFDEVVMGYIRENRNWFRSHAFVSMIYHRDTLAIISDPYGVKRLEEFSELTKKRTVDMLRSWYEANDIVSDITPEVLSGMLRSLNYLSYHEDEIGYEIFEDVIFGLAEGIGLRVTQGGDRYR